MYPSRPSHCVQLICWSNSTELRETFYLPDYRFITKGCNSRTVRWKRRTGQSTRKGLGAPTPSPGVTFSLRLCVFTNPETLNPVIWVFREALLHRHGWWNHWLLVIDSASISFPSPKLGEDGYEGWLKVPTLWSRSSNLLINQPHLPISPPPTTEGLPQVTVLT